MSGRPLSRPRTRVYDSNYNIGESYYRGALDRLDRKYSGRPTSPAPGESSLAKNLLERHERAFADEDLDFSRRRAEKHITENNLFDSRGGRISAAQRAADFMDNDIDEETASMLNRIRANKKVSHIDDMDLDSTISNLKSLRMVKTSDKLLDSVGINDNSRRALDQNISIKRRSLKVTSETDNNSGDLTKWSPLVREIDGESAAAIRARRSKTRLDEIDDEMSALAEKQAQRARRSAQLKAFMADNAEESEAMQSSVRSVQRRRVKQTEEY